MALVLGTTWTFEAYLKAPNAGAEDRFGYSLALSGDRLVVGAFGEASCSTAVSATAAMDNGCSADGAAYVYLRTGTTWTFKAHLKAPNAGAHDNFGYSLALSGYRLVVGAFGEDSWSTPSSGDFSLVSLV